MSWVYTNKVCRLRERHGCLYAGKIQHDFPSHFFERQGVDDTKIERRRVRCL